MGFERKLVKEREREREIKVVIGRDNKAEDERKQHEEIERDMTFGQTSGEVLVLRLWTGERCRASPPPLLPP